MTQKEKTIYLHVLEWKPEGIEFNGIVGKPSKASSWQTRNARLCR